MNDTTSIQADYLIVGAGAMGMAFVDTLMTETDATFIIVDKHGKPGGHWNDAYPFVRLHQPSAFYGVNSLKLGKDAIDQVGFNKGLHELASGAEVCAYFDHVMQRQFLSSGRVQYFPMCEYTGDKQFRSLVTGDEFDVKANKVVDATYMNVSVPSVRPPVYEVDSAVDCIPLNELPRMSAPYDEYVVVGAGKTGMDACLWLLSNHVTPEAITWITPRDSWILDRANIQPGNAGGITGVIGTAYQMEAVATSTSIDDMFEKVNAKGLLLRIDDTQKPEMYRCATVTTLELEQLKRIKNVVRKGRVQSITRGKIQLENGDQATNENALYIDCTADALARMPVKPIFDGPLITLQTVRFCQQVFSAAFIAHIEAGDKSEEEKNTLCTVVPHPNTANDWMRATLGLITNQAAWSADPELTQWLANARLDGFSQPMDVNSAPPPEAAAAQETIAKHGLDAITKLTQYIAEDEAS